MSYTPKTTSRSSGRSTVQYRNVDGTRMNAVVTGGTGSSLDLFVPQLPKASQYKTGIAKMTVRTQTNVWMGRV